MFDNAGKNKVAAILAPVGLVIGLSAASVQAADDGPFVTTPGGMGVVNNFGECWEGVGGMSSTGNCGAKEMKAMDGDADGDGSVGVGDLNYLLHDFGSRGIDLAADLNDDRLIDINDLNIMLSNWGSPCVAAPPPSGGTQPVDDAVHAQDRDDRTTTAAARLIP